jgi:hypothetical protein
VEVPDAPVELLERILRSPPIVLGLVAQALELVLLALLARPGAGRLGRRHDELLELLADFLVGRFDAVFLAEDFLAGAFLAGAFLLDVFLADVFLAVDFLAGDFLAVELDADFFAVDFCAAEVPPLDFLAVRFEAVFLLDDFFAGDDFLADERLDRFSSDPLRELDDFFAEERRDRLPEPPEDSCCPDSDWSSSSEPSS